MFLAKKGQKIKDKDRTVRSLPPGTARQEGSRRVLPSCYFFTFPVLQA